MIRIAFLRHGHTAWNRAHRIQGRTDIPLDDAGSETLKQLSLPAPWDQAQLVSSPLQRAVQTAHCLARPALMANALTEMNWGNWEGAHGADLRADPTSGYRDIEHWGWDFRPPGGEALTEVRARVEPWLESVTTDTVAVTHIGIMRVALAIAYDWDFTGPCPFTIKRNRLFVIVKTDDRWTAEPDPIRLIARSP